MRLYAFLLVAGAALCARAASIPVAETEKKIIDAVPDNLDKLSENASSEQELIDQENTINDVDNKLRAKPEDIPVEIIVDKAQPDLKTDEEQNEEINRPVPDLRNPGPPQRQEHETQNPEFYASEQQSVALFKQSISDAQNVLSQGFQGITDGIQHIIETNEPIQTLQLSILSLRDSFTAQIVKVNETIQNILNTESASDDKPAVEQTKADAHQIEQGLFKLRNEFNRGVSSLASGIDVVAALKADSEANNENSGSTASSATAAPSPAPVNPLAQIIQNMQTQIQTGMENMQQQFQINLQNMQQLFNRVPASTASSAGAAGPAGVQSDPQVTSAPATETNFFQNIQNNIQNNLNQFTSFWQRPNQGLAQNQGQPGQGLIPQPLQPGQGAIPQPLQPGQGAIPQPLQTGQGVIPQQLQPGQGPFAAINTAITNFVTSWTNNNNNNNKPGTEAPQSTAASSGQPVETSSKPDSKPEAQTEPTKPTAGAETHAQADAVTPAGPIRQILQNNPITKGIAGAVQRLQNINNPEKPRHEQTAEQDKNLDQDKESTKGHGPNTGDTYDSSDRIEQPEEVKGEIEKVPEVTKVPEVPKASEDEIKEHKTEEVVDKTE